MKKIFFSLAFIFIISFSFSLTISTTQKHILLEPGKCVYVDVNCENSENIALDSVSLYVQPLPGLSAPSLINIGSLGPLSSSSLSLPICADKNAKEGEYVLYLKVKGRYKYNDGEVGDFSYSAATLSISILRLPKIEIKFSKIVNCSTNLTIVNEGGEANDVWLKPLPPFSLLNQSAIFIGTINKTAKTRLVFNCAHFDKGVVNLSLLITYSIKNQQNLSKIIPLSIPSDMPELRFKLLTEGTIVRKEPTKISFVFVNDGRAMEDVRISLNNDILTLVNQSFLFFGSVGKGRKKISALVWSKAPPGYYLVPATISFRDHGVLKEKKINVPIIVEETKRADILLETRKEKDLLFTTITITNPTDFAMEGVEVGINSTCLVDTGNYNKQYIGKIDEGDFGTVQFKLKPKKEGTCELSVIAHYLDQSGKSKEVVKSFVVEIEKEEEKKDNLLCFAGGFIAIILVIIIMWKIRERK